MKVRRAVVVVVAVWVAVVMVGSTMVWAVISRAGREVAAVSDPNTVPGTVFRRASDDPSIHPGNKLSQRPHGGHHHGHGSDDPTTPSGSDPTGPQSSAPGTPGGSSSPGDPKPTRQPPSTPAGPQPVQDTWNGRPGSITLECTGPARTNLVVVPADGYRWEVDDQTSSSSVTVKFERVGSDGEFEVKSYCQGGVPRFHAESSGGQDDKSEERG
jgi:hypothetical protein